MIGSKEKIKLSFLRLYDNPLLKHLILNNFLYPMVVLSYLAKLKKESGASFGAVFLHCFSMKTFCI